MIQVYYKGWNRVEAAKSEEYVEASRILASVVKEN
jgi:hypothetical protein